MIRRTFTIKTLAGIHLKPAAALCSEAIKYQCSVTLSFGDTVTNAKSVLNLLSACVKCNDDITLICDGEDEEEAMKNLGKLIEEGLGE